MLTTALLVPRLPRRELDQPPLPEEVREAVARLDEVVQEYRRMRPAAGSDDEQRLLLDFVRASGGIMAQLGPEFFSIIREQLDPALRSAWRRELEGADDVKKFAVHQLGRALESLGLMVEAVARDLEGVAPEVAERLTSMTTTLLSRPDAPLDADTRQFLRWEADLAAGLASLDGDVQELAHWASRAARGARSVQAQLATLLPRRERGDLLLHQAQHSWDEWDEEEIREELRPWAGD
jgi:hypothetical protein